MQESSPRVEKKDLGDKPKFVVREFSTHTGPKYLIYFMTIDEAEQAVRNFWGKRRDYQFEQQGLGSVDPRSRAPSLTERGLVSGMLHPTKQMITSGDRTMPRELFPDEKKQHPDMNFAVEFNGNTEGLHEAGTAALKKLGYIK